MIANPLWKLTKIGTCCFLTVAFFRLITVDVGLAEKGRFAYFFDQSGNFLKIKVSNNKVIAHGRLREIDGLGKLLPSDVRDGVLVNALRYDPHLDRIYLVIQKTRWVTHQGKARFQIFVLELPTFRLVATFPQEPFDFVPRFLITPDGSKLLLSYSESRDEVPKKHVFILETYDTRSFQLLSRKSREVLEEKLGHRTTADYIKAAQGLYFSENAHFGPDGETIYDEGYQIIGDQAIKQVPPILPPEIEKFSAQHPCWPHSCFLLRWIDERRRRILLWELVYQERTRPIYDGSTGRSWEERYRVPYATGRFALYDALARPRLSEFQIKALEGENPRLISFTPDGRVMYWAKGNKELYAVTLTPNPRPVRIEIHGLRAHDAWCIFADR